MKRLQTRRITSDDAGSEVSVPVRGNGRETLDHSLRGIPMNMSAIVSVPVRGNGRGTNCPENSNL